MTAPKHPHAEPLVVSDRARKAAEQRDTDLVCTACRWRAGHSPDCVHKDVPWPTIPAAFERDLRPALPDMASLIERLRRLAPNDGTFALWMAGNEDVFTVANAMHEAADAIAKLSADGAETTARIVAWLLGEFDPSSSEEWNRAIAYVRSAIKDGDHLKQDEGL